MDLGAVFFLLSVLILVGMYLYAPFISRTRRIDAHEEHELSSLLAERDRLITSLQELDFDHNLGKIPEQDYPVQRAELLRKGADVLRQLDARQPGMTAGGPVETRLERAAAGRADAPASSGLTDDEIESMLAARRRMIKMIKEKSAGFCPRCGQAVLVSDRFCPACGKSLTG
jgi:hypothetical protein